MTQIESPAPPPHPYPYPYAPVVQPRTNGLAIASLVLGITWVWWIGSLLAVIFGVIALKQIEESNGTQTGKGMAIAGLVLGFVGFAVVGFIIIMMIIGSAASTTGY